jgi:hypothetical protein
MIYPIDANTITVTRKPGDRGIGGKVFEVEVDGLRLDNVQDIKLDGGAEQMAYVTITLIAKLVITDDEDSDTTT